MRLIIPTYKRYDVLLQKTLAYLLTTDLAAHQVDIFVSDTSEAALYEEALKKAPDINANIIVGVRGIPNQRNFIQKYYPEGEELVMIDDDITVINGKNKNGDMRPVKKLSQLISSGFEICKAHGTIYWGIGSNSIPIQLRQSYSYGFIYIVGNFIGLINDKSGAVYVDEGLKYKTRLEFKSGKESHERAILVTKKYGGVIKLMGFGLVSKYWKEPGGHQISRTPEGEKTISIQMIKEYPDLLGYREVDGIGDIVFKTKTKSIKYPIFVT